MTTETKIPKLTKAQRRLLLRLAREEAHRHYPHRRDRLPVGALVALGYVVAERHNGSYHVTLTEAGFARAERFQAQEVARFEEKSRRSIAVGAGPWPEVLRPWPLSKPLVKASQDA